MKKILTLIIAVIGLLGFTVAAQGSGNPFSWRANVKMLNANEGEVILKVSIASGWHLYGTDLPKGGPKPTVFDLSKSKGVKFIGKMATSSKPETKMDEMFNLKLTYWTGTVTFRQRFKVTDRANARVEGTVGYMGCNDYTCSPPKTFNFSKPVIIK